MTRRPSAARVRRLLSYLPIAVDDATPLIADGIRTARGVEESLQAQIDDARARLVTERSLRIAAEGEAVDAAEEAERERANGTKWLADFERASNAATNFQLAALDAAKRLACAEAERDAAVKDAEHSAHLLRLRTVHCDEATADAQSGTP